MTGNSGELAAKFTARVSLACSSGRSWSMFPRSDGPLPSISRGVSCLPHGMADGRPDNAILMVDLAVAAMCDKKSDMLFGMAVRCDVRVLGIQT